MALSLWTSTLFGLSNSFTLRYRYEGSTADLPEIVQVFVRDISRDADNIIFTDTQKKDRGGSTLITLDFILQGIPDLKGIKNCFTERPTANNGNLGFPILINYKGVENENTDLTIYYWVIRSNWNNIRT